MNRLYLDIETLPTVNPDHIADIAASVTPLGNISKADTIAAWEAEKKPALVTEAVAKTSFNGAYGRVCCVGWAWNDASPQSLHLVDNEGNLLRSVNALIEAQRPKVDAFHQTQIIGHYVADFDIRFLWQRAFVLGVKMPAWFPRDPKPWSKEVFDTMHAWAGAKGSISLDNLCKALGIEGKTGVDGSMVAGMWADGKHKEVGEYCIEDVERVRNVHRKMQIALGERE